MKIVPDTAWINRVEQHCFHIRCQVQCRRREPAKYQELKITLRHFSYCNLQAQKAIGNCVMSVMPVLPCHINHKSSIKYCGQKGYGSSQCQAKTYFSCPSLKCALEQSSSRLNISLLRSILECSSWPEVISWRILYQADCINPTYQSTP